MPYKEIIKKRCPLNCFARASRFLKFVIVLTAKSFRDFNNESNSACSYSLRYKGLIRSLLFACGKLPPCRLANTTFASVFLF